jgi:hypothetical protein
MAQMTEEWVSLWYQCLAQNIDYSIYCDALDMGDTAKRVEIESRFEKVSGIYADFGTLDGWPEDGIQSRMWGAWFEPRKHLFLSVARCVADVQHYTALPGYLLIEVPLQCDAGTTTAVIGELLDQHYADHLAVVAPGPKYVLNQRDGRNAHGVVQVRQACRSVVRSYRYDPETFEELRHHDAVAAFIRHEIDNMGWTLDPKAREQLERDGTLSEQRLNSYKAMLNRCRRDFKAFAANTIRASFPDDRPFESSVLDIF